MIGAKEANGVTWIDFGPRLTGTVTLRWVSVYPDHYLEAYNPHEPNIPWTTDACSQEAYDKGLVGDNTPGVMGPYQPIFHYVTREAFEDLGRNLDPDRIPAWM